ncbi:hypothetical protein F5B21DRAFT_504906 [Xylaria acuta]|nr:hypothetical protein F5B21DRAFT_504906 [Xylaria acuta]
MNAYDEPYQKPSKEMRKQSHLEMIREAPENGLVVLDGGNSPANIERAAVICIICQKRFIDKRNRNRHTQANHPGHADSRRSSH